MALPAETTVNPTRPKVTSQIAESHTVRVTVVRFVYSLVLFEDVFHLGAHQDLFLTTREWPHFPIGAFCVVWLGALGCGKNDSVPWRQIGSIQSGRVNWEALPKSGSEKLGDYMEQILR
jgi:hypothetical protein